MSEDNITKMLEDRKKIVFDINNALQREELRVLLSNYGGRAFYWRLLGECGVYKRSFTGDNVTFFNEGKRHIGLWMMEELFTSCPEMFILMQSEALKREERDKLEIANQEENDFNG